MSQNHLVQHIRHPELSNDNTLHVVGVLFNPMRYHSRLRLFRKWYEEMKATPNVKVYVVELAFGDRKFEVTEAGDPTHLQLRGRQEIWHKESLINLGVKHLLPLDWKYLSWCDTDVHFMDPHWAQEAMQQMQHYALIQPWRDCSDLGFNGEILQTFQSFCYIHRLGVPKQTHPSQPYKYAHSGYVWCCTRKFWEAVGGLMEWCIVGSGDHHQAWAAIGNVAASVHGEMPEGFKRKAREWEQRAYRATNGGQLGFVPTRIEHEFHGPKNKRRYRERWQIFIDHKFDPYEHLTYDEQGLVTLVGKPRLQEECREYLGFRHEDDTCNY